MVAWRAAATGRVALKVLRPHIVGDDEARRLEREVGSLSGSGEVGRRDRRRRSVAPSRTSRPATSGSLAARLRARGGVDQGQGPDLAAACLAEGVGVGARGRRAASRREALRRADGGPDADPHRLRPGPGRQRPEAGPPGWLLGTPATSRPRSCTARTPPLPPTSLLGGHRRFRRDRQAAFRPRAVDGHHDRVRRGEHQPSRISIRCASSSPTASTPTPSVGRRSRRSWAGCGRRSPHVADERPPHAGQARRSRTPPPPRPHPDTGRPTCCERATVGADGTKISPGAGP